MDGVTISYEAMWGVVGFILQMGALICTLIVWGAKIDGRLKAVEAHGEKVEAIAPLQTAFNGFKEEIERRMSGMERKVDDVHTLLLRAAAVSNSR